MVHWAPDTDPLGQAAAATSFPIRGFTNLSIDYLGDDTAAGTIALASTRDVATARARLPNANT